MTTARWKTAAAHMELWSATKNFLMITRHFSCIGIELTTVSRDLEEFEAGITELQELSLSIDRYTLRIEACLSCCKIAEIISRHHRTDCEGAKTWFKIRLLQNDWPSSWVWQDLVGSVVDWEQAPHQLRFGSPEQVGRLKHERRLNEHTGLPDWTFAKLHFNQERPSLNVLKAFIEQVDMNEMCKVSGYKLFWRLDSIMLSWCTSGVLRAI